MSEYTWAKIEIGGPISRPVLANLVEKFGVAPPSPAEAGAASPEAGASSYLVLEDDEASDGMFAELEAYLTELAIPFDRASDGGYEHSPELRKFRPRVSSDLGGLSRKNIDRTFLCDHDNRPMVASADIDTALAETQTREELAARLVVLCGLDVPTLPPPSIIEATD